MNKEKAERRVMRKVNRALSCPFCGNIPRFDCRVIDYGKSIGHYAERLKCCQVMSMGQVELFYVRDGKPADYRLWKGMVDRLINDWNRRVPC